MDEFRYYPSKTKNFRYYPSSLIKRNFTINDRLKLKEDCNSHYMNEILKSFEEKDKKKKFITSRNHSSDKDEMDKMFISLKINDNKRNNSKDLNNMLIDVKFKDKIYNDNELDNVLISFNFNDTEGNKQFETLNYISDTESYRNYQNIIKTLNKSPRCKTLGDILLKKDYKNNNQLSKTIFNSHRKNISDIANFADYTIKPYKKKSIISNTYKKRKKIRNMKMNYFTPKKFYDSYDNKYSNSKNLPINNNNEDEKTYVKIGPKRSKFSSSLITMLCNNENYFNNTNYNYNFNERNRTLYREKPNTSYKENKTFEISPEKYYDIKFNTKLYKVLLILVETHCKAYLMRTKYLFWNKLTKYIEKNKKAKKIEKYKKIDCNNYYKKKFIMKEKRRNKLYIKRHRGNIGKLLINKSKDENNNTSPKIKNNSELLNRWKDRIDQKRKTPKLYKKVLNLSDNYYFEGSLLSNQNDEKEKEIKHYKKIDIKSSDNSNDKSIKNGNIKKNNITIFKKTKPINHNLRIVNNGINKSAIKDNNNSKEKIIIVKNISNINNKIFIDVKYIGHICFVHNRIQNQMYSNLKICNNFSIDLIRQSSDKEVIIQKIGHKHFNSKNKNKKETSNKNNLIFIQEG